MVAESRDYSLFNVQDESLQEPSNAYQSSLPEINLNKNVESSRRLHEIHSKFNSNFNQIMASQEMISPKVGSPVNQRSVDLLPLSTERNSKLQLSKLDEPYRHHSRIRSNQAFTVQHSPPAQDRVSNVSVKEWAEIQNYQRELDEEKIKKEREAAENKKQIHRFNLDVQLREKRDRLVKEKEAQRRLEQMLIQYGRDRIEQEENLKHQKHSRTHQQKAVATQ